MIEEHVLHKEINKLSMEIIHYQNQNKKESCAQIKYFKDGWKKLDIY